MSCFIPSQALIYNLLPAGQVATPWLGGGVGKIGNTKLEWKDIVGNEEKEEELMEGRQVL